MASPRILYVDHTGSLGGAELYLFDAARHTPNAHVVLFEDGPLREKLESENVPVTLLPAPPAVLDVSRSAGLPALLRALPALFGLVFRLARLARNADVLYLNSQKALIVGALAGRLAQRPVVWNLHDVLTADHFSRFTRQLAVFWANHFVDRVVVNSNATRRAFEESGGQTPTQLVYNGVDPAPYAAVTDTQLAALRQNLSVGDAPLVGVFSRLSPWKGQHVLLDALADLPDVHALIVGDALFGTDADYAAQLRHQRDALNLTNRVHFLGFREDIPALMHLVDVVVHTSTAPEPFGRVVVEGMMTGTPVVATAAGGVLEIIDSGRNGLLVPPSDASALHAALGQLLSTPAEARRLADAGRRTALDRFSVESMLSGITASIAAVCEPSPADGPPAPSAPMRDPDSSRVQRAPHRNIPLDP